jgi:hypothetical protein
LYGSSEVMVPSCHPSAGSRPTTCHELPCHSSAR